MRRVLLACFPAAFALLLVACGDQPKETSVESPGSRVTPLQAAPVAGEVPSWAKVAREQLEAAKQAGVPVAFENSIGMRFVLVPAGTFTMGSPADEDGRHTGERQHRVTLTQPFYVSIYETTNGEYRRFNSDHDSWKWEQNSQAEALGAGTQPVVYVSHTEAVEFAAWLSRKESGRTYRLPTESEWEYAARAQTMTKWYWGDDEGGFLQNANIADVRGKAKFGWGEVAGPWDDGFAVTSPVGAFRPNGWGLYDMIGNVREWCADWKADYPPGSVTDPTGAASGSFRVQRGGSWRDEAGDARTACRLADSPVGSDALSGFRLVVPARAAR